MTSISLTVLLEAFQGMRSINGFPKILAGRQKLRERDADPFGSAS